MEIVRAECFRLIRDNWIRILFFSSILAAIFQVVAFFMGTDFFYHIEQSKLSVFQVGNGYEFGIMKIHEIKEVSAYSMEEVLKSLLCKNMIAIFLGLLIASYINRFRNKVLLFLKVRQKTDFKITVSMICSVFIISNSMMVLYFITLIVSILLCMNVYGNVMTMTVSCLKLLIYVWELLNAFILVAIAVAVYCKKMVLAVLVLETLIVSGGICFRLFEVIIGKAECIQQFWMLSQIEKIFEISGTVTIISTDSARCILLGMIFTFITIFKIKYAGKEQYT